MPGLKEKIAQMAAKYDLQVIYAFGSRAKEALEAVEGRRERLSSSPSDLDIGVKPEGPLTVEEKVEIVFGEILYASDSTHEAEYQLHIMRMAADLLPYERAKQKMILGA